MNVIKYLQIYADARVLRFNLLLFRILRFSHNIQYTFICHCNSMRIFFIWFCLLQFHPFFDCTFQFCLVFVHCIGYADRVNLISHSIDSNLLSVMNYTRNNIVKQVLHMNEHTKLKAVIMIGPKLEKKKVKIKLKDSKMSV